MAIARLSIVGAFAAMISQAIYGGIAFARERRDRSGDFLNAMPVPRSRIIASKLLVTLSGAAVPWLLGLSLYGLVMPEENGLGAWRSLFGYGGDAVAWCVLGWSMGLVGMAWLCSSFLRSETIAAGISFVLVAKVTWLIYVVMDRSASIGRSEWNPDVHRPLYLILVGWMTGGMGVLGLVAGCVIARRRPV